MRFFTTLLAALFLTSCMHPKDAGSNPGKALGLDDSQATQDVMTSTTDTAQCKTTTPADASIAGDWYARGEWADTKIIKELFIENSQATLTVFCTTHGQDRSTKVTVASHWSNSQLDFLEHKLSTQGIDPNTACISEIKVGSFSYSLVGNCLKLSDSDQANDLIFVRDLKL